MIRGSNADCALPNADELRLLFIVANDAPPAGEIAPTKFV